METLYRLIDLSDPIAPGTSCAEAAAMFDADPAKPALAIVDADRAPIGLVYRDVLQGMMRVAEDTLAGKPISEVMDTAPRIVAAQTDASSFVNALADSPTPVFRTAYIAVDAAGRYVGVGGLGSLLASHRRRQRDARDAMGMAERMAVDIGAHLDGVLAITERLEQQRLTPDASAFVRAIGEPGFNPALLELMIGLAQRLEVKIVALGVTSIEQVSWLKQAGCPMMQGDFFAQPMNHVQLLCWLREQAGLQDY